MGDCPRNVGRPGLLPERAGNSRFRGRCRHCLWSGRSISPAWFGLAALAFSLPAIRSAVVSVKHFGRRDPPQVVIDEVVGQWLVVAVVAQDSWQSWLASLLLFRIFDIVKPWPIRKLESLPGGVGIVADDAAAGLCAIIVMKVLQYFSVW